MTNSIYGDPRQSSTLTLFFSITKRVHLVHNRRTDMGSRCWVETNLASTWIIAKSAKNYTPCEKLQRLLHKLPTLFCVHCLCTLSHISWDILSGYFVCTSFGSLQGEMYLELSVKYKVKQRKKVNFRK